MVRDNPEPLRQGKKFHLQFNVRPFYPVFLHATTSYLILKFDIFVLNSSPF